MERKIGDTFEHEGKKLIVEESKSGSCVGCFFNGQCPLIVRKTAGECQAESRVDNKYVIFVEVKNQSQKETESVEERKIGEVFDYEGKQLRVEDFKNGCDDCFFDGQCSKRKAEITGACGDSNREDVKNVIFVEVQPQQKLNLCELLKYCPKGTKFWSPLLGEVELSFTRDSSVFVEYSNGEIWDINSDGTTTLGGVTSPEIMLYPSREQRDWSKVKYEPKKELPRTWAEFCVTHDIKMSEYFIGETGNIFNSNGGKRIPDISKTILPSEQAAEAHLAYMQLHQLRDAWREGWVPNWKDVLNDKYVILMSKDEFVVQKYSFKSCFLSFQDEKRANEFLECFKDLIEKAGDLI